MNDIIVKNYGSRLTAFEIADDDPEGTFTAKVSVFGNVDSDGDVVHAGAFTKTVSENAGRFPLVWQHQMHNPIGVTNEMAETATELATKAAFNMYVRQGAEGYHLMKQGALRGFSFAAKIIKADPTGNGAGLHLRELKLYEVSAVTLPANELAQLTGIKSVDGGRLAAIVQEFEKSEGAVITDAIDALSALLARRGGAAAPNEVEPGHVSTLREFIGDLRTHGV